MGIRILIAEDEDTLRAVISEVLADDGHEVTAVPSGERALEEFKANPFPLVLTDIVMGRMSGIELLQAVKEFDPAALVIIMTSHASLETATAALRVGAHDYLMKPFDDLDTISKIVGKAVTQIEATQTKVMETKKQIESLEAMATRDGLTGLYNHRHFRQELAKELSRAERYGRPFSLVFVDVDHLKKYNDTHGHLAGDEVLRTVASLLSGQVRKDTLVARYGGEEFVILLPECDSLVAGSISESIREAVESHVFSGEETQPLGRLTLSLGVACYPYDATNAESLIDRADQALYQAKNGGRNRVCVWYADLGSSSAA